MAGGSRARFSIDLFGSPGHALLGRGKVVAEG
jgi:hypothetical protein